MLLCEPCGPVHGLNPGDTRFAHLHSDHPQALYVLMVSSWYLGDKKVLPAVSRVFVIFRRRKCLSTCFSDNSLSTYVISYAVNRATMLVQIREIVEGKELR